MKQSINLTQSYIQLPAVFHSVIKPYNNQKSEIVLLNESLIKELNINDDFLKSEEGTLFLSGSTNKHGQLFSQAYAGHQYAHFTNLGDGRAVLLGEYDNNGHKIDLQLKGSGRTPYSRRGDGLATLYSMLREYLISEAMYHLTIPTTRSLAVLKTNKTIQRLSEEQGGILCRTASSHIRVGTFEYASATQNIDNIIKLTDYTINRHYNYLNDKEDKYKLFLREVIKKQAKLIAKWQSVGFVHGVMNTDNMTISGETIDYGPCAFLDSYDPSISFSSIDSESRYSYQNQPYIGSWNLARFAESLLPLLSKDKEQAISIANKELSMYQEYYFESYYNLFGNKLGLSNPIKEDKDVIDELLLIMKKYGADFTNTFRLLTLNKFEELSIFNKEEFNTWFQKWTRQLGYRKLEPNEWGTVMKKHNPVLIPRNQLVEKALQDASKNNDYTLFDELLERLKYPYNYNINHSDLFLEPANTEENFVTYCGT